MGDGRGDLEPGQLNGLLVALYGAAAALSGYALFAARDDAFGVIGVLGVMACAALVMIAKELRKALERSEEHYGR